MFLSCIVCAFCLFSFSDEVSVTEESLPRIPPPPQEEIRTPFIKSLKGIVLTHGEAFIKDFPDKKGVHIIDLNVPGKRQKLIDQLKLFLGKEVDAQTLSQIKEEIFSFYLSNDHPLVIIEIPTQDITSGVLEIQVIEARLGQVKVEGNKWTSGERLREYMQLRPSQEIDENRLLQSVSFMNRNPFRRVDVIYAPGDKNEATDVILSLRERRASRIYVGAENTGVEPTGRGRWYTGVNIGKMFGLDHVFSYQFTSGLNVQRFHAHTGEYLAFFSWGHALNVYGGYSEVHPKIHYPFNRNDGWSLQASARYTIPLRLSRHLEHEIFFGGDFKRMNNTFEFSEDFPLFGNNVNLTQFVWGYRGNYEKNRYRLDFNGDFFWSPGKWLADQSNRDYESLRPEAKNSWIYFRGSFVYLQRLPHFFSLSLMARGQVSSEPLLPSEQFGLGGYDTVRGYDQREVNKDDAIFLSVEGRSPPLPILKKMKGTWKGNDALQFLLFLDYGWGINIDSIPTQKKSDYLLGAGPGLRYTIDPYLTFRLDWGIKLHKEASYGGGNTMIHFNVTASY